MPKRTELTSDQRRSVADQYRSGVTCQRIAQRLGVSFAIVKRVLEEEGVYEPGRRFAGRYSAEQKREMAERYLAGETCGGIAKRFGCTRLNVRNILIRQGVEIRTYRTYPLDPALAPIIKARRDDGLNFTTIARELGLPPHRVLRWAREMGISDFKAKRGADSPAWRGGRTTHHGYSHIRIDPSDPLHEMAGRNDYAPEHRIVVARSLGRPLTRHETVHHINGDRQDNRLENLQLRKGQHGKGVVYVCHSCGSHDVGPVQLAE